MPFGSHRQSRGARSCFAHGVSEDGGSLPALAANLAEGEKGTAPAPGSRRLRWRAWHGDESRASRHLSYLEKGKWKDIENSLDEHKAWKDEIE